ncbi:MAG TPA: ABC transporter permease [Planctomycetota bacterium]|nr:ABC transporter permease [Planctomycetota bacterium]
MIIRPEEQVGTIGRRILLLIHGAGYNLILLFRTLSYIGGIFRRSREVLRQMYITGVLSLPLTMLVALFTGMVLALQTGIELLRWGIQAEIGTIVAASMSREMGPIWTGIVLAARVGSGMAAELGTMKVSEEIDALEVMSIDPARYLVLPRLVALVLVAPILTIYSDLIGVLGGAIVGQYQLGVSFDQYFRKGMDALRVMDIYSGLVKSMVFATIIAIVGCSQGLRTTGGAEGVGNATRNTVVISLILIIIFNYFITSMTRWIQ